MSARLVFVLVLFFIASTAFPVVSADPVGDLHAASVAVADQSADTRAAALRDAMAQVLVKITGSRAILDNEQGLALLENPARFLQQYRYESVRPVPEDPAAPRLLLHADFDGAALERRLRAAGVALWGRERPLTLVWLALSNSSERRLLGASAPQAVTAALRDAAARRGLPLVLPMLDTEDLTRVSFMDVWGVFEEPLLAAATRYSPDAVLVGSVFDAGDGLWAGRWTLLREGERQRWELSAPTPEAVAAAAIDALAEHYASAFLVHALGDGQGRTELEITDVDDLRDYAAVQDYLAALSVVKDVRLLAVDGETLRYELELNTTVRALQQAIALGRVLEPLPAETVVALGTAPADDGGAVPPGTTLPAQGTSLQELPQQDVTQQTSPPVPVLRYRFRR